MKAPTVEAIPISVLEEIKAEIEKFIKDFDILMKTLIIRDKIIQISGS